MSNLFEEYLTVSSEDIEFELRGKSLSWENFLLNPRRLRGSDFLMRWSQGVWSEHRFIEAVDKTDFFAIPYGPSGTAPHEVREFELYFLRLDAAGLGKIKRPDLMIFKKSDFEFINKIINEVGGIAELPFSKEDSKEMQKLLNKAIVAIECENSLWKGKQMPDFGCALTPQKRLGGKLGVKKTAVLPTVIVKEEDREPLKQWQGLRNIPIHVWHGFYDLAYGIALDRIEELIAQGRILPTEQTFQAPGGATQKKEIYKICYQYAYPLGLTKEEPKLVAASITDKNGHILPYVKFEGGTFNLCPEALKVLNDLAK